MHFAADGGSGAARSQNETRPWRDRVALACAESAQRTQGDPRSDDVAQYTQHRATGKRGQPPVKIEARFFIGVGTVAATAVIEGSPWPRAKARKVVQKRSLFSL
jgi:hypothetical protein